MSNDTTLERLYELTMSGAPENRGCVFYAQGRLDFLWAARVNFMSEFPDYNLY